MPAGGPAVPGPPRQLLRAACDATAIIDANLQRGWVVTTNRLRIFFFSAAILIFAASLACGRQPAGLRIAYPEFPPFHWRDADGRMKGFFYDIIQLALEERLDTPLTWTPYPWIRCQESVKSGSEDAIITVPTRERLAYARTHGQPFYRKRLRLFTYAGHPQLAEIREIDSVAGIKRLGLSVITYRGNGWHQTHVASLGITTFETAYLENVWLMLANRRGDLVIEWPAGAAPDLTRLRLHERVVETPAEVAAMPFHLLIRKASPHVELLKRFDAVITGMRDDGTILAILNDYGL